MKNVLAFMLSVILSCLCNLIVSSPSFAGPKFKKGDCITTTQLNHKSGPLELTREVHRFYYKIIEVSSKHYIAKVKLASLGELPGSWSAPKDIPIKEFDREGFYPTKTTEFTEPVKIACEEVPLGRYEKK